MFASQHFVRATPGRNVAILLALGIAAVLFGPMAFVGGMYAMSHSSWLGSTPYSGRAAIPFERTAWLAAWNDGGGARYLMLEGDVFRRLGHRMGAVGLLHLRIDEPPAESGVPMLAGATAMITGGARRRARPTVLVFGPRAPAQNARHGPRPGCCSRSRRRCRMGAVIALLLTRAGCR
jgi:hypothetical protein